jgi:hypothetical protein
MGDAPTCPACGKPIGLMPLLLPLSVELEAWGWRWGDIAFGTGNQILVSDRLMGLFIEARLVGLEFMGAVRVVKAKKQKRTTGELPTYHLASVQRSRAAVDQLASGLVREGGPICPECRTGGIVKRADRILLEANTWSGEDVFIARGLPGTILTSERFQRLCSEHQLANCSLVPAEEYSFDHYRHGPR